MKILALLLALGLQAGAADSERPEPPEMERLRELAELGLDAELVTTGQAWIGPGGALAGAAEAAALVARSLFLTGRETEAFETLAAARPTDRAGRAAIELMRARLLLERDDLAGALRLLVEEPNGRTAPKYPDVPDCLLLLGRALVRSDRHDLAEPPLRAFVEKAPLHPEGPSAWHMLFEAALRRNDLAGAKTCRAEKERWTQWHALLRARRLQIRRQPEARLPRLGLALLWIEARELERAEEALEDLLARFPQDAEAWLHLGEVHRMAGRATDAARAYGRSLEQDPTEHRARYSLALLHRDAGRTADARRELEHLLGTEAADEPAFLGAHLELARLLGAAGEADEAARRYARYRELGGTEELGG
ncbi:MAG: tetratricopeptide repeat protein [Planctomycetota bacterium]